MPDPQLKLDCLLTTVLRFYPVADLLFPQTFRDYRESTLTRQYWGMKIKELKDRAHLPA